MATRRRNVKTHPKPTGDDGVQDDFMPLDRPDRDTGEDGGRTEVVDVFAKETVTVGAGGDGRTVDLNSATEGDARAMASEGGSDADAGDGTENTRTNARRSPGPRDTQSGAGTADDEPEGYSARVRKRIARERALVNRERVLREQTQRELAAERTARKAQDERIARLERQQTEVAGNTSVKDLESQIAALKPQLAAVLEAGETAKTLDLQDKLSDLKAKLEVLKYDLAQRTRAAEANQGGERTRTAQESTDTTSVVDDPQVAELAAQFRRANRHWWNRSSSKEAREDAITIDKEILDDIRSGELDFAPYSDEHFEELANRLHETYPDLEIQDLDAQPYEFTDEDDMNPRKSGDNGRQQNGGGPRQGGRGAAPIARRGDNGRRGPNEKDLARQGKVTLDEADFKTMRLFKLDPNSATDKKYFAKEKMRSILSGQRQSGDNR